MKIFSEWMAIIIRLASVMSLLLLVACQQQVSKPQMEVRLKPLSWQSENKVLTNKDLAELATWLNQFPTRDVFLQTSGRQEAELKQFLLDYGFRTWQLDGINFSTEQPDAEQNINRIVGVYVQRSPGRCPDYEVANASDGLGNQSSNFGCANQRNLMVSVADSRDFIRGKALAPASAEKLVLALQNYYGRADDNATNETGDQQQNPPSTGVTSNLSGQGN